MNDSKKIKLTIGSIIKKMARGMLNPRYPLQREIKQWKPKDVGNFISDLLQGNPMPELVFAEQEIYDAVVTWIIDGAQRTTYAESFANNEISIAKNIDRYMIEYSVAVVDEDGVPVKDEDGIIVHEKHEFDIRGKKFKQLPKELQERFLDYGFDIVLYLDCSEENIAYHIKRYNAGKPMNTEQKGITRIGVHFANMVKNISSMSFFEDAIGDYTLSQFKSGKINRVIIESVMAVSYLDNWTKEFSDICEFIKDNAIDSNFVEFKKLVERLELNVDETVGKMFNGKDSMLWFGLYSKFVKLGLEDEKFNDFMLKLKKGMYTYDDNGKAVKGAPMTGICTIEIDGTTYEELLKNASTKDTNVVKNRVIFLTKLMCHCLGVDEIECITTNTFVCDEEVETFINEFMQTEIPHNNRKTALKSLMNFTSYPERDFTEEGVLKFETWLNENNVSKDEFDDCILSTYNLRDYINNAGAADYLSANDIAILIHYTYVNSEEIDEGLFEEWLENFENTNDCEQNGDNQSILEKETYMVNDFKTYINNK